MSHKISIHFSKIVYNASKRQLNKVLCQGVKSLSFWLKEFDLQVRVKIEMDSTAEFLLSSAYISLLVGNEVCFMCRFVSLNSFEHVTD